MKEESSEQIFTTAVKRRIEVVTDRLSANFRLDPLRRSEVKANIMEYLWRNARYYDPQLSEWYTFACLVVKSGVKRERVRLTEEAQLAQRCVSVSPEQEGEMENRMPDPRGNADMIAFAVDLADVLSRMPASTAAILHDVVVEGMSFTEAAIRFGYSPRSFFRRVWPRVRKDFLLAGGEFFRRGGQ